MSGFFFSLGGENQQQQNQQQSETNYTLFLSKNEEIYNRGFELWQQDYQFQQQKLQSHHGDFTIGAPSSNIGGGDEPPNYSNYRSAGLGFNKVMDQLGGSENDDGLHCQDCGNQAKKDCVHLRCRTCCKSRGYPCPTHVKSTWVPAAKRRERQQQQLQQDQRQLMTGVENPKRLRDDPAGGVGGGFEMGHFPPELNSAAVFRCVRVSAVDDGDEQLAYQTAVNIGGHVFKGILYDQGPESQVPSGGGGGKGPSGSQQQHDLIAGRGDGGCATSSAAASSLMLDPAIYSSQLSGFMAGTQYFLPPRH